jgi:hypothetical protein
MKGKVMRTKAAETFFTWFWNVVYAAFAMTLLLMSISFEARAHHGGVVKVGDTPTIYAWCKSVEDVEDVAVHFDDEAAYWMYMANPATDCVDMRLTSSRPVNVTVLAVVKQITVNAIDGKHAVSIVRVMDSAETVNYVWHDDGKVTDI